MIKQPTNILSDKVIICEKLRAICGGGCFHCARRRRRQKLVKTGLNIKINKTISNCIYYINIVMNIHKEEIKQKTLTHAAS